MANLVNSIVKNVTDFTQDQIEKINLGLQDGSELELDSDVDSDENDNDIPTVDNDDDSDDTDDDDDDDDNIENNDDVEDDKEDDSDDDKYNDKVSIDITSEDNVYDVEDDDDDSSDEEYDDKYLKKFDENLRKNIIEENHQEALIHNNEEVLALSKVIRNDKGVIIDHLHRTHPYMTKYERSRILGIRAAQINAGCPLFISPPKDVLQGSIIAEMELRAKKLPFIIRRPIPNRGFEYWNVEDLQII